MNNISETGNQRKEELFQAEDDRIGGGHNCSAGEAMLLMCEAILAHNKIKK